MKPSGANDQGEFGRTEEKTCWTKTHRRDTSSDHCSIRKERKKVSGPGPRGLTGGGRGEARSHREAAFDRKEIIAALVSQRLVDYHEEENAG